MKKIIKRMLNNKKICRFFVKKSTQLHNLSYRLATKFSIHYNDGVHPKHRIINYKKWFLDNVKKDDVVLDIGCNTGTLAKCLASKAEYVYGIEILSGLIDKANQLNKVDNVEYICADATEYDYSNCKPIDVVVLSNVLEHIEERTKFLNKLKEQINWKSKPRFLIRVPMITRDWISCYKRELGVEWRLDKTHFVEYCKKDLIDEIEKSGLRAELIKTEFGEGYLQCS